MFDPGGCEIAAADDECWGCEEAVDPVEDTQSAVAVARTLAVDTRRLRWPGPRPKTV